MNLALIVAATVDGVIGSTSKSPLWLLPADLARFKQLTNNHAVIMGRKTFESIGRPLPNRKNIVLSRHSSYSPPGCIVVNTIPMAIAAASDCENTFIIGGGEIYAQMLQYADTIYLTEVQAKIAGNVLFSFNKIGWNRVSRETHPADDKNQYSYAFEQYNRTK